jgi:predicted neuraminidase
MRVIGEIMNENAAIFQQLADRPLAHCATLCELCDGTLLAAWFSGTYETAPDVVILGARSTSEESAWSRPEVIVEYPGHALGQPVFLSRTNAELWLFFNVVMNSSTKNMAFNALPPLAGWVSAQPYMQISHDNGLSWETPLHLMDCLGLMFRSRPMVLSDRIILPVYDEATWQSRMMISVDDGQTWRLTDPLTTPQGNIHPCVVELTGGRLLAYLRTGGQGGVIWRTESHDRGDTWTQPTPTNIPNPNSGLDLLHLHSGRLLLAFNNSSHQRTPLCVALADEDERWYWMQTLEDGDGEFSYPTLLQTADDDIHVVYTYQREHIHYARFDESWLLESKETYEFAD